MLGRSKAESLREATVMRAERQKSSGLDEKDVLRILRGEVKEIKEMMGRVNNALQKLASEKR